MLVKTEITWR